MLNLKKLIASVCVLTLMLSTVAFGATYTDVAEDSAYYEAVESLSKLGIVTGYEDGTYKPEDVVTRAEMAALIARIQGYDETAKNSANTIFTDVPSSHWASGYVAQATNQQIINGYGDGTFGPEDPVLYEQAVKMIMATLGYTPYAKNNGDYPTGYLAAASRYGVTDRVSNATIGVGANRGTVAQLLSNAIDTPIMAQSSWNTDGSVEYKIYDGNDGRAYKTLMSENLGVVKLRGVVTANSLTAIDEAIEIDTSEDATVTIKITGNYDTNNKDFAAKYEDGTFLYYGDAAESTFLVGETDAEDYLGKAVIFYVVVNEDDYYEIISIAEDSTKNDILTFTLDQFDVIAEAPTDSENGVIRYFKNASDKTSTKRTLTKGADVVFNGVGGQTLTTVLSDAGNDGYVSTNGTSQYGGLITLIDNDGVTGYEVVIVELAATAVVDEVSDETIAFKEAAVLADGDTLATIEVDAEDTTSKAVIIKDGAEIAYTDLVEWDVLSILVASDDASYVVAEVISNPVVGTIVSDSKSTTSATDRSYKIGDSKYDVALGSYGTDNLAVGDGGTFYIDKYGKIAAFNEDAALATGVTGSYGYVFKAVVDEDLIDDTTVTLQLVTKDGVEILDLAASVKFSTDAATDPISLKVEDAIALADPDEDDAHVSNDGTGPIEFFGEDIRGEVVKFTKNAAGKINNITMADFNDEKFAEVSVSSSPAAFDADNSKIGSAYIDSDAIIFFKGSNADNTVVGTVADLDDNGVYTILKAYADANAEDSNIIVLDGGLNNVGVTAGLAVLTEVASSVDENENEIYSLTFLVDGAEVTADTIALSDMDSSALNYGAEMPTVGDIVKIKINSAGKIASLNYVYNFGDDVRDASIASAPSYTSSNSGAYSQGTNEVIYGGLVKGYKKSSSQVTLMDDNAYKLSQAENVYVIDTTGRKIEVKVGSAASFRYYENLYFDGIIEVEADKISETLITGNTNAAFRYADWVYVRTFENKVKDVIIVKGPEGLKATKAATVTVSFDVNGQDVEEPDDVEVAKGYAMDEADPLDDTDTHEFLYWGATEDAEEEYDWTEDVDSDMTLYAIWAEIVAE